MSQSKDIEKNYAKLLVLAKTHDECFEEQSGGWGRQNIQIKKVSEYWRTRGLLESGIADWMASIRKAINGLPANVKKYVREQRTDYETQDVYSVYTYDNKDYEALLGFLGDVNKRIEGHQGILNLVERSSQISEKLREIRGKVLSLCRSLEIFVPEIMVTIDQQVELVFKLREKGMVEAALLIEELDQTEDNIKKCLNARAALEKVVEAFLRGKEIEVKKGFYTNLDNAIEAGLTTKTKRKAIAGQYSFVSKIVHKEIEANPRNTQYGVNGLIIALQSFSL